MVDKRIIEQVLAEQYEELVALHNVELCSRKEEEQVDLDSNMAQVVIGVRRSGKSTLCFNVLKSLNEKFAYVNFDDERFSELQTSDLNTVLEALYKIYGDFNHLFLDEIQNIDGSAYQVYMEHFKDVSWAKKIDGGRIKRAGTAGKSSTPCT